MAKRRVDKRGLAVGIGDVVVGSAVLLLLGGLAVVLVPVVLLATWSGSSGRAWTVGGLLVVGVLLIAVLLIGRGARRVGRSSGGAGRGAGLGTLVLVGVLGGVIVWSVLRAAGAHAGFDLLAYVPVVLVPMVGGVVLARRGAVAGDGETDEGVDAPQ